MSKKVKVIYVFCEGETEVSYFKKAKTDFRKPSSHIKVICMDGLQQTIVKEAFELYKDLSSSYRKVTRKVHDDDTVFCVCDRDNKSIGEVQKLFDEADLLNMTLLESNPSFELWVKLHFEEHLFDEKIDQKSLKKEIREIFRKKGLKYKEGQDDLYLILRGHQLLAINRACKLREKHQLACREKLDTNPSTYIDLIIERYKK